MELYNHWHRVRERFRISARAPSVLKSGPAVFLRAFLIEGHFKKTRRRVWGLLFLACSIGLGFWAHDLASTEALATWQKEHAPSELIWNFTLASYGYHKQEDPSIQARAVRSLPLNLDARSSIWVSSDLDWVAVFLRPDESPKIYAHSFASASPKTKLPAPPKEWQRAGTSWTGFEAVLQRIGSAPAQLVKERGHKTVPRDPRELFY